MSSVPYDRPLLPWLLAVAAYAMVAGLVVLLSLTLRRAAGRAGWKGQEERDRIAEGLRELKNAHGAVRTPAFARFFREYLVEPRVLHCPEVAPHMEAPYWPEPEAPEDDMAYCYISGLTQKHSAGWAVAFDDEWNHPGRGANVLYIGGHVRWVDDHEELRRALDRQLSSPRATMVHARVRRPWWSRTPDPPPFLTSEARQESSSALPTVAAAVALAAAALSLARIARRAPRRWRQDHRPPASRK